MIFRKSYVDIFEFLDPHQPNGIVEYALNPPKITHHHSFTNQPQQHCQEIFPQIDFRNIATTNINIKKNFPECKNKTGEGHVHQREKSKYNSGPATHIRVTPNMGNEEEYSSRSIFNIQQSTSENHTSYLSLINDIFESFEAAMRASQNSTDFVCCLINLHQNEAIDSCFTCGHVGPSLEKFFHHINALQTSFANFAYSCKTFQDMLETDQIELLQKNALMFVMVCI